MGPENSYFNQNLNSIVIITIFLLSILDAEIVFLISFYEFTCVLSQSSLECITTNPKKL